MNLFKIVLRGLTWRGVGVVVLLNTAIVILLTPFFENTFLDLFIGGQCLGLTIMLAVNVANNWRSPPLREPWTLVLAILGGSLAGTLLMWVIKGRSLHLIVEKSHVFFTNIALGVLLDAGFGYAFIVREREARARAHHQAEENLLSKQVAEARLMLLQAQIEPHFLYNTLANVQVLVETDPPAASKMIDNLIRYLRAAIPQMRESGTTLGRDMEMVRAYLDILTIRMGARLSYTIDLPRELADLSIPPMMLLSLVENAIKHGLEAVREGGSILNPRGKNRRPVASYGDRFRTGLSRRLGHRPRRGARQCPRTSRHPVRRRRPAYT